MQVYFSNHHINFGTLKYQNKQLVDQAICKKTELKTCLKQAENDLKDTKSNLVIYSPDGYLFSHYVELDNDDRLTYIEGAKRNENQRNILEVSGYVYDSVDGFKDIDYAKCDLIFKSETAAEKYEKAINNYKSTSDVDYINRAVLVAKAIDEDEENILPETHNNPATSDKNTIPKNPHFEEGDFFGRSPSNSKKCNILLKY